MRKITTTGVAIMVVGLAAACDSAAHTNPTTLVHTATHSASPSPSHTSVDFNKNPKALAADWQKSANYALRNASDKEFFNQDYDAVDTTANPLGGRRLLIQTKFVDAVTESHFYSHLKIISTRT
jgi:phosphate-selective porin